MANNNMNMSEKIHPLVVVEITHENGISEYYQMYDVPESKLDYFDKVYKVITPLDYGKRSQI